MIGTGLKVSLAVKGLHRLGPSVSDVCEKVWMEAEKWEQEPGAYIISSTLTLGVSEETLFQDTFACVAELIKMEKRIARIENARIKGTPENTWCGLVC